MTFLYLDIFSGISGDMFLGAMIDLGVDFHKLEHELARLKLDGYHLHVARQQKSNIEGVKFDVRVTHAHDQNHGAHGHTHHAGHDHSHSHEGKPHAPEKEQVHGRNFADIKKLIGSSALSEWVKQKAIAVFQRVAIAEGKIHGHPPEEVHFHEVGAVDSIVDIVGACIAVEMLGKPRMFAAPVVEGTGWVDCAHGRFPVPTTATLEILGARGVALTQCEEPHELVTPTGAALLAEFVESFGPMENLAAEKIGYGLGTRDHKTRPNILRAVLGKSIRPAVPGLGTVAAAESAAGGNDWETDIIAVLETNLDDINAEILGQVMERAFDLGALDVFHTAVQMKKNRPGVLLTLLCAAVDADKFSELILRETSAFGVRRHLAERRKLSREFKTVKTSFGEVTVKIGKLNGRVVQVSPEFESCKKVAAASQHPLKEIYEAAIQAAKR